YLLLNVQLPDAASVERTRAAMAQIEDLAHSLPGVQHTVGISGTSIILNANAPNLGSMYVMLKEFAERRGPGMSADEIGETPGDRGRGEARQSRVRAFGAPPTDGLGTTAGFKMIIEDRASLGLDTLQRVSDAVVQQGNATADKTPGVQGLFNGSRANTPWLYL